MDDEINYDSDSVNGCFVVWVISGFLIGCRFLYSKQSAGDCLYLERHYSAFTELISTTFCCIIKYWYIGYLILE